MRCKDSASAAFAGVHDEDRIHQPHQPRDRDGPRTRSRLETHHQGRPHLPDASEVVQDHPGTCPKCGMALEPKTVVPEAEDEDSGLRDMTRRCRWGAVLTLPVFVVAMADLVPTWRSLVHRRPNMFTLIALGVGAAYLFSAAVMFFPRWFPPGTGHAGPPPLYFEAAADMGIDMGNGTDIAMESSGMTLVKGDLQASCVPSDSDER